MPGTIKNENVRGLLVIATPAEVVWQLVMKNRVHLAGSKDLLKVRHWTIKLTYLEIRRRRIVCMLLNVQFEVNGYRSCVGCTMATGQAIRVTEQGGRLLLLRSCYA
jgi:hypothetical protein